jgi:hypothetical protein
MALTVLFAWNGWRDWRVGDVATLGECVPLSCYGLQMPD